jgi:O-6-methylguanine DNA methyltransferase
MKRQGEKEGTVSLAIRTEAGEFMATYSAVGLTRLNFPESISGKSGAIHAVSNEMCEWHRLTSTAVKNVLAGRDTGMLPPLDWSGATEFQQAVWRAMLRILTGQTRSYGEIATEIGRPKAVRAVGGACGANPIPVLVPCHRVLAAGGKIGGFSGGLDWKRRLLSGEGVRKFSQGQRGFIFENPRLKKSALSADGSFFESSVQSSPGCVQ